MSVNSKMTAIADAIREKTGGTDPLSLDQMAIDIANISGGGFDVDAIQAIYDDFTYTGTMLKEVKIMDGVPYALFTFETSGTLTINGSYTGDIWLCGAGSSGGNNSGNSSGETVSSGGGGGYPLNAFAVLLQSGPIVVGEGGLDINATNSPTQGGSSSYMGNIAKGGYSGNIYRSYFTNASYPNASLCACGGCGGGSSYTSLPGLGQGTSTRPFLSQDMSPQCGGGGAYSLLSSSYSVGANGGSDGSDGGVSRAGNSGDQKKSGGGGVCGGGGAGNYIGGALGSNGRGNGDNYVGIGGGFGYGGGSGACGYYGGIGQVNVAAGTPGAVMVRIPLTA